MASKKIRILTPEQAHALYALPDRLTAAGVTNTIQGMLDSIALGNIMSAGANVFNMEQMSPINRPTHPDTISLARNYPSEYTGAVEANYSTPLSGYPQGPGTFITIADPGFLGPEFRGTAFGSVTRTDGGTVSGLRVYYGKVTDAFYEMGYTTTDAQGFFAADLSGVATWQKGEWAFELRSGATTKIGGRWPSEPVYTGITASLIAVTDSEAVISTQPAPVSGVVRFLSSTPGTKRVRLTDNATGELLAVTPIVTGNIRSFVVEPGQPGYGTAFAEQCYVYDQALAVMAAVAAGDDSAHLLVQGLMRLQTKTGTHAGAFRFSGRQESPQFGDPAYRTGAHAFAVHALLAYMLAYPQRAPKIKASAEAGLAWLYARTSNSGNTQGLVLGGFGVYEPIGGGGQSFKEDYPLTWASTEHNIDAYFCYRIAHRVLQGDWGLRATELSQAMMSKLWNQFANRLNQGIGPDGPDTADPLDIHSWGSIFLHHIGETGKAELTMSPAQLENFKFKTVAPNGGIVTGYATAYASPGYPGMAQHVWWEGTFSVAYALKKIGQGARALQVIDEAQPGQNADGSFPYVSNPVPSHELYTYRSVASSAWAVLADIGSGVFDTGAR
ncbi:hypothetical protein SEA_PAULODIABOLI_84 [Microbacterium phage PauloDiaboli]|nr:hypothetical protein SEA_PAULODIABOLI_84 [Microbacterium phage PauloDiaboli]